ncbi:MAG: rod shape-determining protein MreD [Calditrichaceae bacterium]|jgi:rod shape-determining protein MreD
MNHEQKYFITIFVIFGLGAVILQTLFVPYLEIKLWHPDIVVVIVLLIGRRFGSIQGSSAGFLLGIIQDSLTSMPIGISALPKSIIGYASGKMKSVSIGGTMYIVWFVFMIFLHELIIYLFLQFKTELSFAPLVYTRVFPNTIYTTMMFFIISFFFKKYFTEDY